MMFLLAILGVFLMLVSIISESIAIGGFTDDGGFFGDDMTARIGIGVIFTVISVASFVGGFWAIYNAASYFFR